MESHIHYGFICNELKVFSDQSSSLLELNKDLHASMINRSLRGEILSIRKILDHHFQLNCSKYDWEDELPIDINKHCEEKTFQNRVSVRTLVFYWNLWKENIMNIFQSLICLENEEPDKHEGHVEFSLNYFGVRKQCVKGSVVYSLVDNDADWITKFCPTGLHKDGKLLTIDIKELVFAIRSYWQLELLSVCIKVLETLDALHKSKSNGSAFHQSTPLLHIFEVSKFLLDSKYLNLPVPFTKKLQRFVGISTTYFDLVFPLDWRRAVCEDLNSLMDTDLSINLLHEIILQYADVKGDITHWTIGRVMMICLGSRKPVALNEMIITGLQRDPTWKSVGEIWNSSLRSVDAAIPLRNALKETFNANWNSSLRSVVSAISPHSFVHLLDLSFLMESSISGICFSTMSSFVGSFTHLHSANTPSFLLDQKYKNPDFSFFLNIIQDILYNKEDTEAWIRRSKIDVSYYHPLLVLKLVMMVSLICLRSDCSPVLLDLLLWKNDIASLLPKEFVDNLLRNKKDRNLCLSPQMVAAAFMSVEDALLILSSKDSITRIKAPSAIFLDLRKSKEEIMSVLFSRNTTVCVQSPSENDDFETVPSSNTLPETNIIVTPSGGRKRVLRMNWKVLDLIKGLLDGVAMNMDRLCAALMIKEKLEKNIGILAIVLADKRFRSGIDTTYVRGASDDMKCLSSLFNTGLNFMRGRRETRENVKAVLERLQMNSVVVDSFLNQYFPSGGSKVILESKSSKASEAHEEKNYRACVALLEQIFVGTKKGKQKKGKKKGRK